MAAFLPEASTVVVVTTVGLIPPGGTITTPTGMTTITYTARIDVVETLLVETKSQAKGNFISYIGTATPNPEIVNPATAQIIGFYGQQTSTASLFKDANTSMGGATPTSADDTTNESAGSVQSAQSSSGVSNGAIAGAAVGCLIAGLLLGFAVAFFFLRRRRQAEQNGAGVFDDSKAYYAASPPIETKLQLDKFLLDSSPDKEIASELRSLGTLIQQHVENNYHLQPVPEDPRVLAASLVQLGVANGGSLAPDALAQLALEPNTRYVALQHVISQVLFTSVDVSSRSALSMLPAPLAAFLRSIPPKEAGDNTEVTSSALNQWRALSAFLLHPARSQRTPLPTSSAAMTPQAAALSDALDTFLGYFVASDEGARSQQRSHLQAVIAETTKLGYVLLSQPSEWRFVHALNQNTGGRVAVVCAGLVKVTGKDGTPYPVPKQVVQPQTVLI
jgi:hypothetical protein